MAVAKSRAGGRRVDTGNRSGFTIIEVVLVLAIAGLIFLMVFIALPALQRAQKDTQRRNDLGELKAQVQQYQSNNNGRLPGKSGSVVKCSSIEENEEGNVEFSTESNDACNFIRNYMNGATAQYNTFVDPAGFSYGLEIDPSAADYSPSDFDEHMIHFVKHSHCNGEEPEKSTNSRDFAVVYKLEGSGTYCEDNGGSAAAVGE